MALRTHGYSVRTAHDGPSALREAAEIPPHVAFVDIGLPVSWEEIAAALDSVASP